MIIEIGDITFSRNIRYLRVRYSYSERDLARLAGVNVYWIKELESEKNSIKISDSVLRKLCSIFCVSVENIVHTDLEEKNRISANCMDGNIDSVT